MDVNPTVTPGQAAKLVGVGAHNIRRWCEWHKAHLSEGANPAFGAPRRLTLHDVEVLKTVNGLRLQGLQTEAINEKLQGMTFAVIDTTGDVEPAQAVQAGPQPESGAIMVVEALQSVVAPLAASQQAQAARIETLERGRRDVWVAFMAGVLVAGVFFLVIVILFSLSR